MNEEYEKQFNMNYMQLSYYLQEKYGHIQGNYFLNEKCKQTNNKIKKIKSDGLFIHHIAEFHENYPTICSLSTTSEALKFPFEFQTSKWLCYCNYIEHIILHYLIHRLRINNYNTIDLDDGICRFQLPELKMWYITKGHIVKGKWNEQAYNVIKNDESTFIEIYNMFYKEFPNAPKYSYKEYISNQKHHK